MKTHTSLGELREVGKNLGITLPAQFFLDRLLVGRFSGEFALQWAVFSDGISRYWRLAADSKKSASKDFLEEEAWLLSDDAEWPFAFVSLCEDFGLCSSEIRATLLAWKAVQVRVNPCSPHWRKAA